MGLGKKMERPKAQVQQQDTGSFIKPTVQSKLKMGSSGDKYEKEADNVANQVVNGGSGEAIQKMGQEEEPVQKMAQEEEAPIQKMEEEEPVQMMEEEESVQKMEEEEPVQKMGKDEEQA